MRYKALFFAALLTSFVGNAAIISVKDGDVAFSEKTLGGDIDITFNKCMANNLYTFSSVAIDGTVVNRTESDNIGPFLVDQRGWTGGNHTNGDRLSAFTRSVDIYVDGVKIDTDTVVRGDILTVEVVNQLLEPVDDSDFAVERAIYNVSGNTIDVALSHEFQCEQAMIERYYGMQSMFIDEFETLTPGGAFDTWTTYPVTSTGNEIQFTKASAPQFSTFIEHSKGGYQATSLTREGLGDYHLVGDEDIIFIGNSWSKTYHKIIGMQPVGKGDRISWHGYYSWFREPVADNSRIAEEPVKTFDYIAYIAGEPYLFHLSPDGTLHSTKLR